MKFYVTYFIIFAGSIFMNCSSAHHTLASRQANKWFDSDIWKNSIALKAYEDIDKKEFYKQYHTNKATWNKVFAFLATHELDRLAAGATALD